MSSTWADSEDTESCQNLLQGPTEVSYNVFALNGESQLRWDPIAFLHLWARPQTAAEQ